MACFEWYGSKEIRQYLRMEPQHSKMEDIYNFNPMVLDQANGWELYKQSCILYRLVGTLSVNVKAFFFFFFILFYIFNAHFTLSLYRILYAYRY